MGKLKCRKTAHRIAFQREAQTFNYSAIHVMNVITAKYLLTLIEKWNIHASANIYRKFHELQVKNRGVFKLSKNASLSKLLKMECDVLYVTVEFNSSRTVLVGKSATNLSQIKGMSFFLSIGLKCLKIKIITTYCRKVRL